MRLISREQEKGLDPLFYSLACIIAVGLAIGTHGTDPGGRAGTLCLVVLGGSTELVGRFHNSEDN